MQPAQDTYYFWGSEPYLIEQRVDKIIATIRDQGGEEPEVLRLDSDEMSSLELKETLHSSSLFALKRVVIISHPAWLGKKQRKAKKADEIARILDNYLDAIPLEQTLIVSCSEHIAANPAAKVLVKRVLVENIKPLTPKAMGDWVREICRNKGMTIEPAAVNMLVGSGQDMYYLENLLEKVALTMPNGNIKPRDLTDELDGRQETSIFKLTDALLHRNTAASLEAFQQLQEQGQPYLLMLHMITGQLVTLAKIKFWQESGLSYSQIAETSKQKDFVIRKMLDKSSRFSAQDIQELFQKLLDLDISLKSQSKDQRILMEAMITEFCNK